MTTTAIAPDSTAVDYSFARPRPDVLAAAGVKLAMRYIGGSVGKQLTAFERDGLWASGIGILLNWENRAADPLAGAGVGGIHGAQAQQQADALRYPDDLPIYVSVDFGVAASQVPAVLAYFQAFKAQNRRPLAIYGGTFIGEQVVNAGLAVHIWKAAASSWSPTPSLHVVLEQHVGIVHPSLSIFTGQVDDNTVIAPLRVWTGEGADQPTAPKGNVYMPALALEPIVADLPCPTGGAWLLAASGAVYAFAGAPFNGGCNGKPYFAGRTAQKLVPAKFADGHDGYQVVATSGETYGPVF